MTKLLAFLGVSALVIVTPGQDTALAIRNTLPGGRAAGVCTAVGVALGHAAWTAWVVSNLGNPKMLAFFTSPLPQFASSFAGLHTLGLTFCTLTLAWLTAYSLAFARAGVLFRRVRVRRAMEAATGTVLIALGVRLAAEQR